jgi:hypothetical protein
LQESGNLRGEVDFGDDSKNPVYGDGVLDAVEEIYEPEKVEETPDA